jgi:hypothetical protein
MEKIISKGPTNSRTILIEIQGEDGKTKQEELRGVRCGLTFPCSMAPGYFVLIGQSAKSNLTGRYPLRLVTESKADMPSELFRTLLDQMGVFRCFEIFTDRGEKNQSYLAAFKKEMTEKRDLQDIKIDFAPYYENFQHGILLVKEWHKSGDLEIYRGTILHDQLKSITTENLKENSQASYFAINALRYVVASFDASLSYPTPTRKRGRPAPDNIIHMKGFI